MDAKLKATRYSAISQIVLGTLLVIFGIADRATIDKKYLNYYYPLETASHTESVVPIWMGAWIMLTGVIGCFGSRKNRERPSTALLITFPAKVDRLIQIPAKGIYRSDLHDIYTNYSIEIDLDFREIGTYLWFSILSISFALIIMIMYTIGVVYIFYIELYCSDQSKEFACSTENVGLGSMIIIFAIIEFVVGIWASTCCCSLGIGCCYPAPQQEPMGQTGSFQSENGPRPIANGVPVRVPTILSHFNNVDGSLRYSAISQLVLGVLLLIVCIVYLIVLVSSFGIRYYQYAIQIGVTFGSAALIIASGSVGYCAARKDALRQSSCAIWGYLALSIVSIVSTVPVVYLYTYSLLVVSTMGRSKEWQVRANVGIGSMIIMCAFIEFVVGIWAIISCTCRSCCSYCNSRQQQQMSTVINVQTTDGLTPHVVTSYTDGVPVLKSAVSLGLPSNISPTFPSELQMGQVMYVKNGYELFVHVVTMGADGFPVAVPDETPDQVPIVSTPQQAAYPLELKFYKDRGSQQQQQQQQQQQLQHARYPIYHDDFEEQQHEATSQLQNEAASLQRHHHARSEEERNHQLSTLV